jgi:hypothetical protein
MSLARLWRPFAAVLVALIIGSLAQPPLPTSAAGCEFVLGFKAIHDAIPEMVGDCLVPEHHEVSTGNTLQETTAWHGKGGLLVWRKADNWTAFTDGAHTWVNGPNGLQKRLNAERFPWEADPVAAAPAAPTPTPAPEYNYFVETTSRPTDVRPGGAVTLCARLSGENAPPVYGAAARIVYQGYTYHATTQEPDGNACVTVTVPVKNPKCYFDAWITYQGREIAVPTWAHREWCRVLPY